MSAMSRRKGGNHEREVVNLLKEKGFPEVARNLDQTRDGGGDIPFGAFLIECKRRASIAIYEWWTQAVTSAEERERTPLLVIRADGKRNLVVMDFEDFLEIVPPGPASMPACTSASVEQQHVQG
jgi:Holliday junction resolvase